MSDCRCCTAPEQGLLVLCTQSRLGPLSQLTELTCIKTHHLQCNISLILSWFFVQSLPWLIFKGGFQWRGTKLWWASLSTKDVFFLILLSFFCLSNMCTLIDQRVMTLTASGVKFNGFFLVMMQFLNNCDCSSILEWEWCNVESSPFLALFNTNCFSLQQLVCTRSLWCMYGCRYDSVLLVGSRNHCWITKQKQTFLQMKKYAADYDCNAASPARSVYLPMSVWAAELSRGRIDGPRAPTCQKQKLL